MWLFARYFMIYIQASDCNSDKRTAGAEHRNSLYKLMVSEADSMSHSVTHCVPS